MRDHEAGTDEKFFAGKICGKVVFYFSVALSAWHLVRRPSPLVLRLSSVTPRPSSVARRPLYVVRRVEGGVQRAESWKLCL